MGLFDDLIPASGVQTVAQPKKDSGPLSWIADTFGPNGNLRGSAIGGVMQGMADPVVGAVQTLANLPGVRNAIGKTVNDTVQAKNAEYETARKSAGRDGFDSSRLLGNIASPTNLAIAAKVPAAAGGLARVGQGALIGAAGGAMDPVVDPENDFWIAKAKQVGAGTVGGAVAAPIIGKAGEYIARKSGAGVQQAAAADVNNAINAALSETGQTINDIPQATYAELRKQVEEAMLHGNKLDAAALLRKKDFETAGVDPLLGQITRDPMLWARERNLRGVSGVGDPIAARLNSQALGLKNGLGEMAGGAAESFRAGEQVSAALKDIDEAMRQRVSGLYTAARNDAGKDLDVPLQGLAQDYAAVLRDFGDKVPSGVRNNFEGLGLLSGNQNRVFTIEDADKLLKVINNNTSTDPATNLALSQLRQSVKNAVTSADPSGGPFKPAVDAAAQRFRLHEAIPALEAASRDTTAADDFIKRFVINGKVNDIRGLSKLLQGINPDAYQQARSQLGADLQRAAFGENTAGDKPFSQERFNKRLRELGTDKLAAFFSPAEIDKIKALGRVGAYIGSEPAGGATNWSNTGSAVMNFLGSVPGIGGAARTAASVVNAATQPVKNAAAARSAIAAEVPVSRADLTPQQSRILAAILGGGSIAGGMTLSDLIGE